MLLFDATDSLPRKQGVVEWMYNPMILKQINNWFAFIYYDHVGFVFCVASRQSKYIMIGLLSTSVGEGTKHQFVWIGVSEINLYEWLFLIQNFEL